MKLLTILLFTTSIYASCTVTKINPDVEFVDCKGSIVYYQINTPKSEFNTEGKIQFYRDKEYLHIFHGELVLRIKGSKIECETDSGFEDCTKTISKEARELVSRIKKIMLDINK